jgi:hypothetical protein
MKELQPGDRVRAKVHTVFGWKGTGTVVEVEPDYSGVVVEKDDAPGATAEFFPDELARTRLRPQPGLLACWSVGPVGHQSKRSSAGLVGSVGV